MTGLQVALPIALIVAIIAEMAMGGYGLGGAMMTASRYANSPGVFAGIVEIAVVGYILIKIMAVVRVFNPMTRSTLFYSGSHLKRSSSPE